MVGKMGLMVDKSAIVVINLFIHELSTALGVLVGLCGAGALGVLV